MRYIPGAQLDKGGGTNYNLTKKEDGWINWNEEEQNHTMRILIPEFEEYQELENK
jgi:hypothetical protein